MEGQPISILEALATRNVIISTKHAGIVDIIENTKNGFLVDKKNSESITKNFVFLNDNKSKILEISNYNKMYFAENFTITIFSEQFIKILNLNAKT